ncbi:MAG: DUF2263 domain-containing protein [Oscillospiraceae bacterium]|nr:DUF2263 domain-containing protein [Oscillospiraceae bacterium]
MNSRKNAMIFRDTQRRCGSHPTLRDAVRRSREHTVLVLEGDALPGHAREQRRRAPAHVFVSGKRSLSAAAAYRDKRVCVLNLAAPYKPCAGIFDCNTQEEVLCRCTTLYPCLDTPAMRAGFYTPHSRKMDPMNNDDCIYTPEVMVFRSDGPAQELLPEREWFTWIS